MLQRVSFCCATANGQFIGKVSAEAESKDVAASIALNNLLVGCDPNTGRWVLASVRKALAAKIDA